MTGSVQIPSIIVDYYFELWIIPESDMKIEFSMKRKKLSKAGGCAHSCVSDESAVRRRTTAA